MQILFVDESGSPSLTNSINSISESQFFVLGGVIIPDDYWHRVKADLDVIRKKYEISGEIKWRYFAPHHKETNSLSHLSAFQKEDLRSEMCRGSFYFPFTFKRWNSVC